MVHRTPKSVKLRATGSGDASKDEMIRSAMHSFDIVPRDDNEADNCGFCKWREGLRRWQNQEVQEKSPPKSLPGQLTLFGDKPRRCATRKNQAPPPTDSLENLGPNGEAGRAGSPATEKNSEER